MRSAFSPFLDSVPRELITVKTDFAQVQLFCTWAEKFKSDFHSEPLKDFLNKDLKKVFAWLIENYHTEEGEIILRPLLYWRMVQEKGHGLDCDDAFIFMASMLRAVGVKKKDILVVEVSEPPALDEYVHIFPALQMSGKILWLDNLPGCEFGKLNYAKKCVRVTRFSDYV